MSTQWKPVTVSSIYAIGWRITEEETREYPQLKFAESESDTGVIISFNSEAESIDDSLTVPKGTKTLAINLVLTTNVDHCFQKAGFDKHRLFYTQGDYGSFQCSDPCHQMAYENRDTIRKMVEAQGYVIDENGILTLPEGATPKMVVPSELVPYCPRCHKPMVMNLRADNSFVEDEGWHRAAERYTDFLRRHRNLKVLFLELAVGYNTPTIIKYSFWRMTHEWKDATYICLNYGEAYAPDEIKRKSVCINGDVGEILDKLYMASL